MLLPAGHCCRGETPEDRLEEAQAAGESAQVVLLQKHLAKALHSSQLTQVCGG
jgi:hypothetical protein